jgi:prephenate dehydrogenase
MRPLSLAVIGLGAVGGSIAWHAKRAGGIRVVGHCSRKGNMIRALKTAAVDELAERLEDAVRGAELVVVAEPARSAAKLLTRVAPLLSPGAMVLSTASVFAPIAVTAADVGLAPRWAASHPLGTNEMLGFEGAGPELLRGSVVYVSGAGPEGDLVVAEAMDFWDGVIGASPVRMEASEHDRRLAWLVQLPRVLAAALGATYGAGGLGGVRWGIEAEERSHLPGDPGELAEAMLADRGTLLAALEAFGAQLLPLRAALEAGDLPRLAVLLESAQRGGDR